MNFLLKHLLCLSALLIGSGLYGAIKVNYLPSDFQGSVFHIAEGTPGALHVSAPRAVKKAAKSTMLVIDLPAEIKLAGSSNIFNRSKDGVIQDKITQEAVKRSGKNFIRYKVQLSQRFRQSAARAWGWEYNTLFFLASPGNAGKSFEMFSTLILDKKKSPEKVIVFKVLPALKKPAKPCRYFELNQHLLSTVHSAPEQLREQLLDLWRGLTVSPVGFGVRPVPYPDSMKKYAGFEGFWTIAAKKTVPTFDYRGFQSFKPFPPERRGLVSPAYLAEDPEGKLDKYVTSSIRRYRKAMPHIRKIFWNVEPVREDCGKYDLEVFARKMKLAKVPTEAEASKRYPEQWRRFRVETTMRVIDKVTSIMKREFPELEVMICGSALSLRHASGTNPRAAGDPRLSDKLSGVDVHSPMQYYCGTRLFDDVVFTLRSLKKPLIGIQDFNEVSARWYAIYTPPQVVQNIVLYGMLGAKGYHSYPRDNYDHRYIQALYDGYSIVSCGEEIWRKGKDITKQCSTEVVSSVPVKYQSADGKWNSIDFNSGAKELRSRVHRLGKETAVSLFNFDTAQACFVKLTVPGVAADSPVVLAPDTRLVRNGKAVTGKDLANGLLLKLPAKSVFVLLAGGKYAVSKTLDISENAKELETLLDKLKKDSSAAYTAQKRGVCASDWAPFGGKLYLRLIAEDNRQIWLDPQTASVIFWKNPIFYGRTKKLRVVADLLRRGRTRGFVGKVDFISSTGRRQISGFKLNSVETGTTYNRAVFSSQIPRYQGVEQWLDPLEGLRFTVEYLLDKTGYKLRQKITLKNLNPRKETVKGSLMVRSYLYGAKHEILADMEDGRFFFNDAKGVLLKKDAQAPLAGKMITHKNWKGGKVMLLLRPNGQKRFCFNTLPDPASAGVYTWSDFVSGRTVECFTSEIVLAPGEEKSFTFSCEAEYISKRNKNYQEKRLK